MTPIDPDTLGSRLGQELAVSEWLTIGQDRIDRFADATDDHQWIHVDAARAAAESPYAATIAHGFLTLSLLSPLLRSALTVSARLAVNYGLNRVRFVSAVPAGSRVRARITPAEVERMPDAVQVVWYIVVEREGGGKPCATAEWIVRYYLHATR